MEIGDKEYFDGVLIVAEEILNADKEPTIEENMLASGYVRLYELALQIIQKEKVPHA